MFGGNSNWRGPVWMPVNALIIRALQNFYLFYGDNFKIECPTGSGRLMNLFEVSKEISDRLVSTFTRDDQGRRPVYGGNEKFQTDPHWRDYILFHGLPRRQRGRVGGSHRTGWTGVVQVSSSSTASWNPSARWKWVRRPRSKEAPEHAQVRDQKGFE